MMVWSLTYSQTSWYEVKWALGSIAIKKVHGGDGIPVELFQVLKDDAVKVLHSICQKLWKTQQWPQDWKRSIFIPIPKKDNAKESSNYCTIALISYASKVMLKILQARLQQYMNRELPDVQAGFRKGRGTRDQIANIRRIIKKAREFQNGNTMGNVWKQIWAGMGHDQMHLESVRSKTFMFLKLKDFSELYNIPLDRICDLPFFPRKGSYY